MKNSKLTQKSIVISLVFLITCVFAIALMNSNNANAEENEKQNLATIVYTNDCHALFDGYYSSDNLCYASASQMKIDAKLNSEDSFLIDGGDHSWASPYSACGPNRLGRDIIDLKRTAHYDLAIPGNHEFEYGREFFQTDLAGRAKAAASGNQTPYDYCACNYFNVDASGNKTLILEPYKIFEIAQTGKKIAFIGIMSPESEVPTWDFEDQTIDLGTDLYKDIQDSITKCEAAGADYIFGLGHLGIYSLSESYGYSSKAVIANTTGLDGFLDGHSHMKTNTTFPNKNGEQIPCVQCGKEFQNIARVCIAQDGTISMELLETYEGKDQTVHSAEEQIASFVDNAFTQDFASSKLNFPFTNSEGNKITDMQESNLGDLAADSLY